MNAKEIARNIVNAYMAKDGEFIRSNFAGLNDEQAKEMAMVMAAVILKNEIANI